MQIPPHWESDARCLHKGEVLELLPAAPGNDLEDRTVEEDDDALNVSHYHSRSGIADRRYFGRDGETSPALRCRVQQRDRHGDDRGRGADRFLAAIVGVG